MAGLEDPAGALAGVFGHDLYTLGEPATNPERGADRSPVHVDALGAGPMVGHAAPVWRGDRFTGVGTDVRPSRLSDECGRLPPASGDVAAADRQGNPVATAEGTAAGGDRPIAVDALPGGIDLAATGGVFRGRGGGRVSAAAIPGTPWRPLTEVQDRAVTAAGASRLAPLRAARGGAVPPPVRGTGPRAGRRRPRSCAR